MLPDGKMLKRKANKGVNGKMSEEKSCKNVFALLTIAVLLVTSIATGVSAVPVSPPEITPLTDPSKAVRYNIDDINVANPNSPLYGKYPLPQRQLSGLTDQSDIPVEAEVTDQEELNKQDLTDQDVHLSFGTSIRTNQNINGVFARQEVIDNLELGTGEDRTLYAPTLTAPRPCPVESSTAYWRYSGYTSTDRMWGVYNFVNGNWAVSIHFDQAAWQDFVTDDYSEGDSYFTTIYNDEGTWRVYLWNFTANNWQEMYSTTQSATNRTPDFGWNIWESIEWDTNWPDPFVEIRSTNLQVRSGSTWYYCTSTYGEIYDNLPDDFDYDYGWTNNYYTWYCGP